MSDHLQTNESEALPDTLSHVDRGLLNTSQINLEALARETSYLHDLNKRPWPQRLGGYFKLSGPGWIQSALTLGGGSGSLSLFAGALAGYALLWVQPASMLFGVIMMGAMAYMTLSTGIRPFHAVNQYAHPVLGWGWALATLFANFIWIFGQFNVSASVIGDMFTVGGRYTPDFVESVGRLVVRDHIPPTEAATIGFGAMAMPLIAMATLWIAWCYGRGSRGVHWFENAMKLLVVAVVVCFVVVAFKTTDRWGDVFKGLFSFEIPKIHEKDKLDVVISMFAAAVGINMTFLFPYTLLARGWGRAHRGLAGFDLGVGMFIPFVFAASCLVISAGNTLHPKLPAIQAKIAEIQNNDALTEKQKQEAIGEAKKPLQNALSMSQSLEPVLGEKWSHIVFGLGFLGMTTSSIVIMMLVSGFALSEVCNGPINGWAFKIGIAFPALGMLGPLVFGKLQMWLMVPISVFCFFFIPIAYVTFFVLMNNKRFLGNDCPRGLRRWMWNAGMILAILVVTCGGGYKILALLKG